MSRDAGKGDARRPMAITREELDARWAATFGGDPAAPLTPAQELAFAGVCARMRQRVLRRLDALNAPEPAEDA